MNSIKNYIESKKDEMTALLARLVAVPSVQGEAEEGFPFGRKPAEALRIMLEAANDAGFITENVDNYAGSADFSELPPELAILSHLDVVPAGDGWTTDPFTLREEDGRLFGRGAIDDKGPAVAALYALKAVKELGIPLKKGVRLIFGTNEENGSADLAYYRSKRTLPPMVFTPDGDYPVINVEKGMLRVFFSAEYSPNFDADNGTVLVGVSGGTVINAVPGKCDFQYISGKDDGVLASFGTVEGTPAHASTPDKGENAITKLLGMRDDWESSLVSGLAKLFPHGETDGASCGLGFSDDISGTMTAVLSLLNMKDGRLSGAIDIRFPIDRSLDEIREIVCGKLTAIGYTIDNAEGVEAHCTDENSPFVQALLSVYEEVTGDEGRCIAIGGGTYVHEIEGGVAFGAEFPGEENNMHSPDESIKVSSLLKNAELMANAIVRLCT